MEKMISSPPSGATPTPPRSPSAWRGGLIDHIDVYRAEKQGGVATQRVEIHYNCIGAFKVPDRRKIPERDILLETRKGVALSYAPTQIAI